MRILTLITVVWLSSFTIAHSLDNNVVLNTCLDGVTVDDIKGQFGETVSIGEVDYCTTENAQPVEGSIFIFGYGHGIFRGGDNEVCFGHGCSMGDVWSRTMKYHPNIASKDYFSLRIKDSDKFQLEKFEVQPIHYAQHVSGFYLKTNDIKKVKMACYIWSNHKKEEKIRLLSECNQRWKERFQPQYWIEFKEGNERRNLKVPTSKVSIE